MRKIRILARISQVGNCGVGWYRQVSPLQQLAKKGKIDLKVIDFNWGEKPVVEPYKMHFNFPEFKGIEDIDKKFYEAFEWADIVYLTRDESMPFVAAHAGLREYFKQKGYKKKLIVDIDDYVQFTRPHNPGYLSFHPGSSYNKMNLKLLNIVDGVTCSTDYLKKVYKNENKKIFVCPNSLDIEWRDKYLNTKPIVKKKKDEIRIGWAGSTGHYENLKVLHRPVLEILKKYKNVTFHYTGLFGDLFEYNEFKNRIRKVKFVDLKKWPEHLKAMDLDIAIAPLADNHFNRGKSNLRVLEYWAAKYPVIASPVEPYKFIKNGKDGILAMEEYEILNAMEELINNPDKRDKLAQAGYNRLNKEYNVSENCNIWLNALTKLNKTSK